MAGTKKDKVEQAKTSKKKAKPQAIETATKVGVDPAVSVKPGDYVYLTYMASQNIRVDTLELTWKNREGQISETISGEDLLRIDRFVRSGILTVGKLPEEAKQRTMPRRMEPRDTKVLDWCKTRLDNVADLRELCSGLTRAGTHLSGWHPKELVEELIRAESRNLSRPYALELLNTARNSGRLVSFMNKPFEAEKHATSEVVYTINAEPTRP